MPSITINLDDDIKKILDKRAKKNLFSLREQIEDILRQSAIRTKGLTSSDDKIDDKLVEIFSRRKKSRKK